MKKIINILSMVLILSCLTGCIFKNKETGAEEITQAIVDTLGNEFNVKYVEYIDSHDYENGETGYLLKMKADEFEFYVKSYNGTCDPFCKVEMVTNILDIVYKFYREEIQSLAQKYQLSINFGNNVKNYSSWEDSFNSSYLISGEINTDELDNFQKFCDEVVKLEYINKLYNIKNDDANNIDNSLTEVYKSDANIVKDNSLIKIYKDGEYIRGQSILESVSK